MWHTIAFVAESRHVDAKALADFALVHEDLYGIVADRGEPEVSTWYVDKMMSDFRASVAAAHLVAAGGTDSHAAYSPRRRSVLN